MSDDFDKDVRKRLQGLNREIRKTPKVTKKKSDPPKPKKGDGKKK